jgi:flotillin
MDYEAASTGLGLGLGFWITLGSVLFVLVGVLLAKMFRRVVEPNEVHIVQSGGKTTIYGKQAIVTGDDGESVVDTKVSNTYFEWPSWWPLIGVQSVVMPLSVFELSLDTYEAYDIGKVPFVVDIVAFFRIEDAAVAAKRVASLSELKTQLTAVLQGAVRTILAKNEIESIMEERSTYGEMFTDEVADQLKAWGVVNVKNIELMDIRDGRESKTVSNIMAKKESFIEKQSREEVAGNIRDAEIAEINARRETEVQAQAAEQKIGERTAEKDKNVGIANEKAQQEIKTQAKETAERDMAVKLVENVRAAEINKDVHVVKAEEDKQTTIIRAEGQREQEVIDADAEKKKTVIVAEGNLAEQLKVAEGILAVGTSEAEAKRLAEMAIVSPQIALATEIGENEGYQTYLVDIRNVEKDEAVGVEQAKALQDAGIKVIVNSGNVPGGMNNLLDVFSASGGTQIASMVEAIKQTDEGAALLNRLGINSDAATKAEVTPRKTRTPRKSAGGNKSA